MSAPAAPLPAVPPDPARRVAHAARDLLARHGLGPDDADRMAEVLHCAGLLFDPEEAQDIATATHDQAIATAEAAVLAYREEDASATARAITARCAQMVRALITTDPGGGPREVTVYRAAYEGEPGPLGTYLSRRAARAHCQALLHAERPGAAVTWVPDSGDEDAAEELCTIEPLTGPRDPEDPPDMTHDVVGTGYTVTPVPVAAAYDAEADS
ncbi:hypothetical protein RM780_07630 [Streptomyces sp. DSM 44917]|uniref:Uncharacterized protein n=1 Tax=Streptomyces boetiae TaxID=3075541 RepID=A0ABU2L644_9ACTN|nr:hypothetical protein [Streptomyces sp. DSM 44917]MDT0306832.1 hypothetical protein [Streptomyces sp. DSM 44917]